jgi:hypothetical protein
LGVAAVRSERQHDGVGDAKRVRGDGRLRRALRLPTSNATTNVIIVASSSTAYETVSLARVDIMAQRSFVSLPPDEGVRMCDPRPVLSRFVALSSRRPSAFSS